MLWTINMDLTGSTVRSSVKASDGTVTELVTDVIDAVNGRVRAITSSLTPGTYKYEIQVTTSASKIVTFPDNGYAQIIVVDDIVV